MLRSEYNKGFSLTFENGLTISVQFGVMNYCERRSLTKDLTDDLKNYITGSKNAEIAIWDKNNIYFSFGDDHVKGWVYADDVADWIYKVKNAKSLNDIKW